MSRNGISHFLSALEKNEEITPSDEEITPSDEEITPSDEEITPSDEEITPSNALDILQISQTQLEEFSLCILQISQSQFKKLPIKQRQNYLKCTVVQFEFSCYKRAQSHSPDEQKKAILKLSKKVDFAHKVILNSSLMKQHDDTQSDQSDEQIPPGLAELNTRIVATFDPKLPDPSLIVTKLKKSGVEPGIIGYHSEELFCLFFDEHTNRGKRVSKIIELKGDIRDLIEEYSEKKKLTCYMVKLTYGTDKYGKVIPMPADLKNAVFVDKIHKRLPPVVATVVEQLALWGFYHIKACPQREVNLDAVKEVLANDVARMFTMEVQEQCLLKQTYCNDAPLQLHLKAKWLHDAYPLELKGGYCVEPVSLKKSESDGIEYISSRKIANLPEYFALMAVLGDRDKVGGSGQNLLEESGKLVGIDFGHSFPENNEILEKLKFDFTFHAPSFLNYSIFLDAPRSALMKGVIRLMQLAGEPLDKTVLTSYGDAFYTLVLKMEEAADLRVFLHYMKKFDELNREDSAHSEEYESIIKTVGKSKGRYIDSREKVISSFKALSHLPAQLIDLLENFEKLWAGKKNTSMRSPDGTVMLQHLRVIRNPVCAWDTGLCDEESVRVAAKFATKKEATDALEVYRKIIGDGNPQSMSIECEDYEVRIVFPKEELSKISQRVSEDRIKKRYHQSDVTLYQKLMQSQEEDSYSESEAVSNVSFFSKTDNSFSGSTPSVDSSSLPPLISV